MEDYFCLFNLKSTFRPFFIQVSSILREALYFLQLSQNFTIDSHVFYKLQLAIMKLFTFLFAELAEQFTICREHVNQSRRWS